MTKEWGYMPRLWIQQEERLPNFSADDLAGSLAALMVYVALCLKANWEEHHTLPRGSASASYTDLQLMLGIARPSVAKGLARLKEEGLIEYQRYLNTGLYQFPDFAPERGGWAKLPGRFLLSAKTGGRIQAFDGFGLRNRHALNALKLYLTILAFRNRNNVYTQIGYDSIPKYTGMQRNEIRRAHALLVSQNLIDVHLSEAFSPDFQGRANVYVIKGLNGDRYQRIEQ